MVLINKEKGRLKLWEKNKTDYRNRIQFVSLHICQMYCKVVGERKLNYGRSIEVEGPLCTLQSSQKLHRMNEFAVFL